jgi:hypothetical protein
MWKPPPVEESEFTGRHVAEIARRRTIIAAALGAFVVGLAWFLTALAPPAPRPIREGYGVGAISVREKDYTTELKCNGCKVECFDRFVVVHVDKAKEPTWIDNYIKVIPWDKIDSLTLLPNPPAR